MQFTLLAFALAGSAVAYAAKISLGHPPAVAISSSYSPSPSVGHAASPTTIIGSYTPTATVASFVNQSTSYQHFNCDTGVHDASTHLLNTITQLHVEEHLDTAGSPVAHAMVNARRAATIYISLYIHVVLTNANKDMVTQEMVTTQAAELNAAYKPYNIQFLLKNADFTVNDAWSIGASGDDDIAMKSALRQGTYVDLNIYFQSDMANVILRKCTLPTTVSKGSSPSLYVVDGCNVAADTMPNRPVYGFNMGKTAVHETGHWLGLLHTFEGYSCTGTGDFVSDTPAESQSTDGCPTSPWKNSCAGQRPGLDPIHNYMDYSTDACYVRFAPGQVTRMGTL